MSLVITYETLFDILRKESSRDELQALPEDFYEQVHAYLQEKKGESTTGYRSRIEYDNSKKIVRELYDRRERKALLLALNKARTQSAIIDTSVLLPQEKNLFHDLVGLLEQTKKGTLAHITGVNKNEHYTNKSTSEPITRQEAPKKNVPKEQAPLESTEPKNPEETIQETPIESKPKKNPTPQGYKKVRFLHAVPKFVGKDMTIFGPYDPGAETELPEEIVTVLLKKGRIEER